MSMTKGTFTELLFSNRADFTNLNTFTTDASLLGGLNLQPTIPPGFFNDASFGKTIGFYAAGLVSSTGTPTYTFTLRLGTTVGSAFLSGTTIGVTAAITTQSGVTNKWWELRANYVCNTPGQGSGNTTLSGAGSIFSPGGFASPFTYAIEPTTPDTATWTATIDASVTQYFNLSVACSASSGSNSITCKQLLAWGYN